MQYNRLWSDTLWVNHVGTIVESGSLGIEKPKLKNVWILSLGRSSHYTIGSNRKVPQSILSDQTAEYVTFFNLSNKFYPSVLIKLSLI